MMSLWLWIAVIAGVWLLLMLLAWAFVAGAARLSEGDDDDE